ncbi:hypothetical protein BT67DRAFT_73745 [Trichocladium antarcticum]|uniref:Uncharacterized protein n=1 Tax=Trichocladium antarcticum TaxID=1450529 RepID=A0AAN6UHD8_9PEZI|nr:hypothetical protein BT67DRAFT_73745 [Trichocladium antarcticum]
MPPPFRMSVPVFAGSDDGPDAPTSTLRHREEAKMEDPHTVRIVVFVLAGVSGFIILALLFRHFYRKYTLSHTYKPAHNDEDSPTTRQTNRRNQDDLEDALTDTQSSTNGQRLSAADAAGVDRNTSVRSVMTLPVYRQKATENERVLGREGERDGIDVVVEMTTAEQEEELRDEEMESMYQIRAARRRQIADREERRRLRREARETNDTVALRALREQTRTSNTQNTYEIDDLRYAHDRIRDTRQRAVSSVSYLDVGVARADGTRVRANSTDSTERMGLLSDAASMAASTTADRNPHASLLHRRDRSASTTLSIDTARTLPNRADSPHLPASANTPSLAALAAPAADRRRRSSSSTSTSTPATTPPHVGGSTPSRAGSSPEMIDAADGDPGDTNSSSMVLMMAPPPGYDEVSLADDAAPSAGHPARRESGSGRGSGRGSPWPDPPPDYDYPGPAAGPADTRNRRLSARMEEVVAQAREDTNVGGGGGGSRAASVPQIVIEPSSARP